MRTGAQGSGFRAAVRTLNNEGADAAGSARAAPSRFSLLHAGRQIALSEEHEFRIGRAHDCQLQLKSGLISRHHARIRVIPGAEAPVVEDLGSRNGVVVNQSRISTPTALKHGDRIWIGSEMLELIDADLSDRSEHLSTLPPAPHALADVENLELTTVTMRMETLSQREKDVLALTVRGLTQREMADRLHISVKTVETHRARLAGKLGCQTRAELVSYAIAAGMLRGL